MSTLCFVKKVGGKGKILDGGRGVPRLVDFFFLLLPQQSADQSQARTVRVRHSDGLRYKDLLVTIAHTVLCTLY
jgi:hypothetical protein